MTQPRIQVSGQHRVAWSAMKQRRLVNSADAAVARGAVNPANQLRIDAFLTDAPHPWSARHPSGSARITPGGKNTSMTTTPGVGAGEVPQVAAIAAYRDTTCTGTAQARAALSVERRVRSGSLIDGRSLINPTRDASPGPGQCHRDTTQLGPDGPGVAAGPGLPVPARPIANMEMRTHERRDLDRYRLSLAHNRQSTFRAGTRGLPAPRPRRGGVPVIRTGTQRPPMA